MTVRWLKTKYSGVEFYHHNTRKHGIRFDCYYRGRFMVKGKSHNIAFGWSSEGWTEKKVL